MESVPLHQRELNVPQHLQQADFDPYIKQSNFFSQHFQHSFGIWEATYIYHTFLYTSTYVTRLRS